jgi:intracellular sulfur oxidation DsrE/DsrF family protein
LLVLGGVSGWLISTLTESGSSRDLGHLFQAISRSDRGAEPGKFMVYVGNSNPVRLKMALDESENLLETYGRVNRKLQVEIIANESGVDLLRADVSHYADRIALMQAKYPNLSLVACTQTLNKLKRRGVSVRLLPDIQSVSSAAEEIKRRLQEGWDYVRV